MKVKELIEVLSNVSPDRNVILTSPEWPYEMQIEKILIHSGDTLQIEGQDPRTIE